MDPVGPRNPSLDPLLKLSARLGMHVEIELVSIDGNERMEFDLVADNQADFRLGYVGISTPIARAIEGHRAEDRIPYTHAGGREIRILAITPSVSSPSTDIAKRREETLRKAIDRAERTNAMIFASSFSGKWGDYDPTGFTDENQPDGPEEKDDL